MDRVNRFVKPAVLLLFLAFEVPGSGTTISWRAGTAAINIVNGRLFVGEELLVDNISLSQSQFSFLFVYKPGSGLITISDQEFPGSREVGSFRGSRLELTLEDLHVRLEAGAPILPGQDRPAWATIDQDFTLSINAPMVGYGDKLDIPRSWQKYVKTDR